MTPKGIQRHVFSTYTRLRIGMIVIAFLFPILLVIGGSWKGIEWQDSMSAYYHAMSSDGSQPMRALFVGALCAIGAFLFLYRGFSKMESWCLNLAGGFSIGVAFFPMAWPVGSGSAFSAHYVCAVLMFICMTIVTWFCTRQTLSLVTNLPHKRWFKTGYRVAGVSMGALPIVVWGYTQLFPELAQHGHQTFLVVAFCIWSFGGYWLIKSLELKESLAEILALNRLLTTEPLREATAKEIVRDILNRRFPDRIQTVLVRAGTRPAAPADTKA